MKRDINASVKTSKLPRILAYGLDYLVIVLVTSVVSYYAINTKLGINYIILDELPTDYRIFYDVIAIAVAILAIIVIPLFNKGRTIGKTVMHLDLTNADNSLISNKKVLIRQGLIIFIFGGLLNPNHIYLVDFFKLNMNNSIDYIQMIINAFSLFCGFMFLFTKGSCTIYDKYLKLNINVNK